MPTQTILTIGDDAAIRRGVVGAHLCRLSGDRSGGHRPRRPAAARTGKPALLVTRSKSGTIYLADTVSA